MKFAVTPKEIPVKQLNKASQTSLLSSKTKSEQKYATYSRVQTHQKTTTSAERRDRP